MDASTNQPADTPALDALIFAGHKLLAVRLVREQRGCSLPEALDALVARYRELRASQPERFSRDDAAYWEGFYS